MKIVQFKDGTYGIRKGFFKTSYRYCDIKQLLRKDSSCEFWWYRNSEYLNDCKLDDLQKVKEVFKLIDDYGTPI